MDDEIKAYFAEKYEKSRVKVVPGHWPDFQSKAEVDEWLNNLALVGKMFKESEAK